MREVIIELKRPYPQTSVVAFNSEAEIELSYRYPDQRSMQGLKDFIEWRL